jgi:hypothetical protein
VTRDNETIESRQRIGQKYATKSYRSAYVSDNYPQLKGFREPAGNLNQEKREYQYPVYPDKHLPKYTPVDDVGKCNNKAKRNRNL